MAEEFDYLKDSKYGKLATSILEDRRKDDDKFLPTGGNLLTLVADVAAKYINKKNVDLQKEQATNIETLTRQYNDVIGTRKDFFNSSAIKKQREDYQLWKNPETKQKARLAKAIEYFNQDKDMIDEFKSLTPYNEYLKLPENAKNSELMTRAMEDLMAASDVYFESITDDAVVVPTQAQYLQEVKQAYETALKEARNDPTKQSFIRKQFYKHFGRDEKGNPRFGLINQDELKNLRVNAEEAAGIGRDNPLAMISDLDIQRREAEKAKVLERPDLSGFDFITGKPQTSKANADDKAIINNALANKDNFFNEQHTFNITNNSGKTRKKSIKDIYDNINLYNGKTNMVGAYDEMSFLSDILTISDSRRKDFEESNYSGRKAPAQQFLLPAIEEVVDRLSNGLPSLGFENVKEIFEPDMKISYTYGSSEQILNTTYATLAERLASLNEEDRATFIDNMNFDVEFKTAIDSLK